MDPFDEVARQCWISSSQEEIIHDSLLSGDSQENLGVFSSDDADQIPSQPTGIAIYSAPDTEESLLPKNPPPDVRRFSSNGRTNLEEETSLLEESLLPQNPPSSNVRRFSSNERTNLDEDTSLNEESLLPQKPTSDVRRFSSNETTNLDEVDALDDANNADKSDALKRKCPTPEKDPGFWKSSTKRCSTSEGKSPAKMNLGFFESSVEKVRPSDSTDVRSAETEVKKSLVCEGKSPMAEEDLGFSKVRGDSSGKHADNEGKTSNDTTKGNSQLKSKRHSTGESENPQKSTAAASPSNASGNDANAINVSRVLERLVQSLSKEGNVNKPVGSPSKSPAVGVVGSGKDPIKDPPLKSANGKDLGLEKFRYNAERDMLTRSSKHRKYRPLKVGVAAKTTPVNVGGSRRLPSTIQNPSKENVAISSDSGEKSTGKELEHLIMAKLVEVANASKKSDDDIGAVDILEVAKRAGYTFPRPRWWPPEDEV